VFSNPKRKNGDQVQPWELYYAGFSPRFVEEAIRDLSQGRLLAIADPWNGIGTTTSVASKLGHQSTGFDLNPAALLYAGMRAAGPEARPAIRRMVQRLEREDQHSVAGRRPEASDPLSAWLDESSIASVRGVEERLLDVIGLPRPASNGSLSQGQVPETLCCLYVALFLALKPVVLRAFSTSNPTWIKKAKEPLQRTAIDYASFISDVRMNLQATLLWAENRLSGLPKPVLGIADSRSIPLVSQSVDLIVTSPPYCTRIDYVVYTLPELALLGFDHRTGVGRLRQQMIGTPLTGRALIGEELGCSSPGVQGLLDQVRAHSTKAASTYYYRFFCQYFLGMQRSVQEMHRVLAPGGDAVMVVQDSYFKEIHVDLPVLVRGMAVEAGLVVEAEESFEAEHNLRWVNSRARVYKSEVRAKEVVLHLRRPR
jgi:DNA modification methylase